MDSLEQESRKCAESLPCNHAAIHSSCARVLWNDQECARVGHNSGTLLMRAGLSERIHKSKQPIPIFVRSATRLSGLAATLRTSSSHH